MEKICSEEFDAQENTCVGVSFVSFPVSFVIFLKNNIYIYIYCFCPYKRL